MVRTIFTDDVMELEVGYIPVVTSPKSGRVLGHSDNNKSKLLLLLSPVNKEDIALNNQIELDEYDIDELISQLEIMKEIISDENKKWENVNKENNEEK